MDSYVEFHNGQKMPLLGLGTWQADNREELERALNEAFDAGYRHFDTAYVYNNEHIIGDVLHGWISSGKVRRDELFIVTKLPSIGMDENRVEHFLNKSLGALKLEYVDLYLMHQAFGLQYVNDTTLYPRVGDKVVLDMGTDHMAIWRAMEKQVEEGRTKSIGVSNFSAKQIERIAENGKILPANLQVEANVYYQRKELREFCKKYGITVCAYAPFGSPGRKQLFAKRGVNFEPPELLVDPIVCAIAKTHCRTPAQILIRFLLQQNIVVIPKSINSKRLRENITVFDFKLSAEEMKELEALDAGAAGRSFNLAAMFPGIELHPESN